MFSGGADGVNRRPSVKIRGGTSEDPSQMVPPSGYNMSQMPPASVYGSQGVPTSAYGQQLPPSAYSSGIGGGAGSGPPLGGGAYGGPPAYGGGPTYGGGPSYGGGPASFAGVPVAKYGVQPQPASGPQGLPLANNYGRSGQQAPPVGNQGSGSLWGQGSPAPHGSPALHGTGSPAAQTSVFRSTSSNASASMRFERTGAGMGMGMGSPQQGPLGRAGGSPQYGGVPQHSASMRFEMGAGGFSGGPGARGSGHPYSPGSNTDTDEASPSKEMAIPDSITMNGKMPPKPGASGASADADAVVTSMSRLSVVSGGSVSASEEGSRGVEFPLTSSGLQAEEEMAACRRFTFEQLVEATDNFSPANFLGRGALDAVYKGRLMGCKVAVKKLECNSFQGPIEYRTEVEVLSRMRHPHIVLLMGHCPEEHCLVYEFLSGGSVQKCLEGGKGRRHLRWFERVKVLAQVVDALLYLHHHDPPIVHRDLNPENVLIDANLTVKLADVGLARLIRDDDTVTAGPKGTPGFIDPEEILTCEVSVLGDVYALGLIGLQLLLGERSIQKLQKLLSEAKAGAGARGLSKVADIIMAKLDYGAGEWPNDLTRQLAVVLLRCADQQRMRRPDLAEEVQPLMQKAAERAAQESQRQTEGLNSQLICPLSKIRMTDPVLAADGFTYERGAMEQWLQSNGNSPVTGQPLEHTFLTPNNGLRQLLMQS